MAKCTIPKAEGEVVQNFRKQAENNQQLQEVVRKETDSNKASENSRRDSILIDERYIVGGKVIMEH